jgi:Flp pilus assembly protein protease CpaA
MNSKEWFVMDKSLFILAILISASIIDYRIKIIPNVINCYIFFLNFNIVLYINDPQLFIIDICRLFIILIFGFLLQYFNIWGGGDTKLIAAMLYPLTIENIFVLLSILYFLLFIYFISRKFNKLIFINTKEADKHKPFAPIFTVSYFFYLVIE